MFSFQMTSFKFPAIVLAGILSVPERISLILFVTLPTPTLAAFK